MQIKTWLLPYSGKVWWIIWFSQLRKSIQIGVYNLYFFGCSSTQNQYSLWWSLSCRYLLWEEVFANHTFLLRKIICGLWFYHIHNRWYVKGMWIQKCVLTLILLMHSRLCKFHKIKRLYVLNSHYIWSFLLPWYFLSISTT